MPNPTNPCEAPPEITISAKPSAAGKINQLTREQREATFAYCDNVTLKQGVLWLKQEFNLDTSESALSAWMRRQRATSPFALRLESLRQLNEQIILVRKIFRAVTGISAANSVLIAQVVFEELKKKEEDRDEKRVVELMRLVLRARDQEIREKAVTLRGAKRAAGKPAPDTDATAGDEQEKIDKVMLTLFGPEPAGFDSPSGFEPYKKPTRPGVAGGETR